MLKNNRIYIICFIVAIAFKSGFFIYKLVDFTHVNISYTNIIGIEGGDTKTYISPIDNFIENGDYFDDHRMPGYGFFYYTFRLFLTKTLALNALLIFQLVVDAISVVLLAKISDFFSQNRVVFFLTFSAYCISTFVSIFDLYLLSETLCTSLLIISLYFLLKPNRKDNLWNYFFSGLFLTGSVFMRPIIAPLFILFLLYVLFVILKKSNLYKFKVCVFFLLPFVVIDGVWVVRNYTIYSKFIPLQKSVYYIGDEKTYLISLTAFLNSYGGSAVYWNPKSDITFYKPFATGNSIAEVLPPSFIYTSQFNYDSLLSIKKQIGEIDSIGIYKESAAKKNKLVVDKLNRYTKSIKVEKPFVFYVTSRFNVLYNFVSHSGTYNLYNKLSNELNALEYIIKIFYSILYCAVILFGFIGSMYFLFFGFSNNRLVLLTFTTIYLLLIYPFVFKMDEYRYLVTAYPFLLLIAVFFVYHTINLIFKSVKKYKHRKTL
jgi:hypothetical protein